MPPLVLLATSRHCIAEILPPLNARPPVARARWSIHSSLISSAWEHVRATVPLWSSAGSLTGGSHVGLKRVSTAYRGTFASLKKAIADSVAVWMAVGFSSVPYACEIQTTLLRPDAPDIRPATSRKAESIGGTSASIVHD